MVVTRADGHLTVVNAAALAAIDPVGADGIERGDDDEPTGRLRAEANRRASTWVESTYDRLRIEEFQLQAAGLAASRGVTSVHEMSMHHADLEVLLGHRARLPVDVSPVPGSTSLQDAMAHGFPSIGGDLPIDGSIGARTAALVHPYEDGGGDGELYHDDDQLAEFFHTGHNAGLQVGVHAIGDRAIEQVLATWERVYLALDSRERRHFRARRHRVEHFVLPSADQVERAAMLGLSVSVQPTFDRQWGQGAVCTRSGSDPRARWRPTRSERCSSGDRGRRGLRFAGHAPSTRWPRSPRWRASRAHPAADPARGSEAPPRRERPARAPGREEGRPGARAARGLRRLRRGSARGRDGPEGLRPVLTVSLGREVFRA